jgi:hypothetical protein
MLVFTEHITPRVSYTLNHILKNQFGLEFSVSADFESFNLAKTPKINYSDRHCNAAFQIIPEGLLFEDGLRIGKPEIYNAEELPVLFQQKDGNLFFDIFSAVFWFISRYEEYQEYIPDNHNRFPASQSFAYKNKLLTTPIVDVWVQHFKQKLEQKYTDIELKRTKFSALTTIDVDSPWCYKNKGFLRNAGGMFRDLLKGQINEVFFRVKVLLNIIPDPWYNFDWIAHLHKNTTTNLMFFIHVGEYGTFDKTVKSTSKSFCNFINNVSLNSSIGLHPSYNAASNKKVFQTELTRLSKLSGMEITANRQHYLVFKVATYYPQLIEMGINEDYSMGFADMPGFRAGTSNPFYFFDLHKNQETKLLIHPFAVMDRTLNTYQGQSVEDALETLKLIVENVKKVHGTFVSLWHNESLSNTFEWKGWQSVFQEITEYLAFRK